MRKEECGRKDERGGMRQGDEEEGRREEEGGMRGED